MNLQELYSTKISKELKAELKIDNDLMVPRLVKIVINTGLGAALDDKKIIASMSEQMALIAGQKPIVTRAKRAIATFKLRAGMAIGLKATLRGKRMFMFLEKCINIVLPRIRDFRGIRERSIGTDGNLSIGIDDLTVFPEINSEKLDTIRGLEITIVTTAQNKEHAHALFKKLGMPFEKHT